MIREARSGEQARVGELRVAAYRDLGTLGEGDGYAATLRSFGFGGACTVLVAVDADPDGGPRDAILGTVTRQPFGPHSELARDASEADVRAFAVDPRAQGRGVGRALLQAVVAGAAKDGLRRLRLCTQPAMTTAQRLYAGAGFTRTPDLDFEPAPGVTLRAYVLSLGQRDAGRE